MSLLVRDVMTKQVSSVSVGARVGEAYEILRLQGVRHVPIVSGSQVVGMLSDREFAGLARVLSTFDLGREAYDKYLNQDVSVAMKTRFSEGSDLVTLREEDTLAQAIDVMVDHKLTAIPVIGTGDALTGILSYIDILRAVREGKLTD